MSLKLSIPQPYLKFDLNEMLNGIDCNDTTILTNNIKKLDSQLSSFKMIVKNFFGIPTRYPRCSSTTIPIKAMSINPSAHLLAIAFVDGSIHFCDIVRNIWKDLQLHHEKQIQPSYLSWRPYCKTHIACCAKYDRILLNYHLFLLEMDYVYGRLKYGEMTYLKHPNYMNLNQCEWNNTGSLIAVSSYTNSQILIWNVGKRECHVIISENILPPLTMKWRNDSILAIGGKDLITFYHTVDWSSHSYSLNGTCNNVSFIDDKSIIYTTSQGNIDSISYYYYTYGDFEYNINGSIQNINEIPDFGFNNKIKQMVVDSTSSFIVISLECEDISKSNLLFVYTISESYVHQFKLKGFIEGPKDCEVSLLDSVVIDNEIYIVCCFDNCQIYFYPINRIN